MAKLVLDLHDIYNKGGLIDKALRDVIHEAVDKKIATVEIIPGKGSGQLKKKVIRFLDQKEIKALYHRVDKDSKNFGRLFVYFQHKNDKGKKKRLAIRGGHWGTWELPSARAGTRGRIECLRHSYGHLAEMNLLAVSAVAGVLPEGVVVELIARSESDME
jgi:hypothetical protein